MTSPASAVAYEEAAAMIVALRQCVGSAGQEAADVEQAASALRAYGMAVGYAYTVLLAPSAAIVGGRTLRAPRWVHEAAEELREALARCSIAELVVTSPPEGADVAALLAQVRAATGEARDTGALRWRAVQELALVRGFELEMLDPARHFETAYGWAVAALRRLTRELRSGAAVELRARQIARTLIALPANDLSALVHSDRVRARLSDPAERAIGRSILAIAMMRALSTDANMLAEVAIVSMLLEAVGAPGEHPSVGAHAIQTISRTDDTSVMRTVVAYEALWMAQEGRLGPLWGGERAASAQSCVVHAAMRCFARPETSLQAAIEALANEASNDLQRAAVRLLCSLTGNRLPASAPLRPSPMPEAPARRGSPGPLDARPSSPSAREPAAFSDQDMADILADLGGSSLPSVPRSPTPPRPISARPGDGRASHAPVARTSDKPRSPSGPPSVVPSTALTPEQREGGAQRSFDQAEAAYAMGELEEALEHADHAVTLEPQQPRYVALQAYLEAIQDESGKLAAEALIARVDRVMKEADARAHYYRGMLLRCVGKPFAARQAFRRGLELAPEDPDLRNALQEH